MTYIWNRVDRVPSEMMPETLTKSFQEWSKGEYQKFTIVTDRKKRQHILKNIQRQTENYQDALKVYELRKKD